MPIVVEIDGVKRNWSDITPDWIARQITQRRRDGSDVCVRIHVTEAGAAWPTANCPRSGGGGGAPSGPLVRQIDELYDKFDLDEEGYTPGNVIAFVEQVDRLL